LADCRNSAQLATAEKNFDDDILQKLVYNEPKSMLGIWIPVKDPNPFDHIQILARAMAVCSQLNTELKQYPPDLRILILPLWIRSFKTAAFQTEKSVREP
jgi:hypothetical protein